MSLQERSCDVVAQREEETAYVRNAMRSLYDVLDVAEDATPEQLKAAYHRKLLAIHPDKAKESDDSVEACKSAYEVLRERRQLYDQWLREQRLRHSDNELTASVYDTVDANSTDNYPCRCGSEYDIESVRASIVDSALLPCESCSLVLRVVKHNFIGVYCLQEHAMMTTSLWRIEGAQHAATVDLPRAKVVVVGESAVGKTAFVQALCGQPLSTNKQKWTVGAATEVLLHAHNAGTPREHLCFIEIYDIGGSRSHRVARTVFYGHVHGIILVHDVTNRKSAETLRSWLYEVLNETRLAFDRRGPVSNALSRSHNMSLLPTSWAETSILESGDNYDSNTDPPVLVVGTKLDLLPGNRQPQHKQACKVALECKCDEVWLDCRQEIAPASTNSVTVTRFFDEVVTYSQRRSMTTSPALSGYGGIGRRRMHMSSTRYN